MKISKLITTIDTHTGGNPTRTVTSGAPTLLGNTMTEKMVYMKEHHDDFRKLLMYEPRGHGVMSGCILTEPCDPTADIGVVFIETGGYLPMCGHDTIGVCTTLIESGMFPADKTSLRLDTPAGIVDARLTIDDGKVTRVTFTNIPSFLYQKDVVLEIPEIGVITLDIAYGGNFYALVHAKQVSLELTTDHAAEIVRKAIVIREAINQKIEVVHPENPVIRGLTHIEFYTDAINETADCRNAVVIPPGAIDRSPCGTGTSAKIATLFARGELAKKEEFVHESIVGSLFYAQVLSETTVGDIPAIIPQISGSAWVTGFHQFVIDPSDPLLEGFLIL
jgi:proline racemase